jgi:hypothetical protein
MKYQLPLIRNSVFFIIFCCLSFNATAQRAAVRNKIERDLEKKHAEPQRKKGKEEINKVTYENDKRYKDPTRCRLQSLSKIKILIKKVK